jgi:hypothetical protein
MIGESRSFTSFRMTDAKRADFHRNVAASGNATSNLPEEIAWYKTGAFLGFEKQLGFPPKACGNDEQRFVGGSEWRFLCA